MNVAHSSPPRLAPWSLLTRSVAGLFIALFFALAGAGAHAAAPPAGTSISNQASATYSDGSGVARTVTSNLVQTTVTQVYSMTLTANGAQNATPGSVVYYPHTLTNTGNGNDSFTLAGSSGTIQFTMASVVIYADNGSGQPTGSAITSTGVLASGASFKFIVAATVPATASNGQTNAVTVTGTSAGDGTAKQTNTDTTTVTSSAVVTLTKAISASTGAPNTGPYTYTLTYTNTGNSDATAVAITDNIPGGMTYIGGASRWSVTGSTALSDSGGSVGASPNTLISSVNAGTTTFTATIAKVAPGQSGFITFQVNVNSGVAPGVINNTAGLQYNNGATNIVGSSNTVPFTVTQTEGVSLTGATFAGPAAAGSTVPFTNAVKNNGNGTDTFNITLSGSNYPAGTTFQLYKSDGTTPLVDTNGDGIVDTGPIAAGATYNVILKATLPPNATGSGNFSINKTATSILDNTKVSTGADQLTGGITAAGVDLTNKIAGALTGTPGTGATTSGEATVQGTIAVNPNTTAVFTLIAKNTGPGPDSYDLAAAQTGDMATALPTGWSVVFKADGGAGNCSTTGASISNTGTIATTASTTVCAIVTIPAGYDAGTINVYFRTQSPTSAAVDVLHDAVTVNAVRSLTIAPNGAGQTYPGGSIYYVHTLTNNGNVVEGGSGTPLSTITPALANNNAGWTANLYYDANGNGQLDANDTLVTGSLNAVLPSGTIAKGQAVTLFVKVIAPSGAVAGNVNNTTVTVTTTNGSYSTTAPAATVSTDSTSVIAGNLTLTKLQALDANCDGTADGGAASYTQGNLSAGPGQCVLYQITVSNVGAADATGVVISDATPSYTTISKAAATAAPGQITGPAVGASGAITAYIGTGATTSAGGTLAAGQSATVTFGVKIAQ